MKRIKIVISVVLYFSIIAIFSIDLYLYKQINSRDIALEKQICTLSNQVFKLKMELALHKKHKLINNKILGGIGND